MRKIIKLNIIIIFFYAGSLLGQSLKYKINNTTNQIYNIDNYVISFNKYYEYDMDFEKGGDYIYADIRILINLDWEGKGMLKILIDESKYIWNIEYCERKYYRNSKKEYWKFKCNNGLGKIMYYHLDFRSSNNSINEFWYEIENNQRVYFSG